ncbi:MAG TPA: apolipoprotein N-acyltransferase [Syntrophales bacterium]|nr:apolipoprotein N-acyltransferase [Syntrophales bacterium]
MFLSFPKFGHWAFGWVCLVPLLCVLRGRDMAGAFMLGLVAGLVYNVGLLYWVSGVVVQYGHLPLWLGILIMLLLTLYLSLYVSLFAAAVNYLGRRQVPLAVTAPLLWVLLEYGKAHLLTGFPWGSLAYSQYLNLPMIQIADLTGPYGVSFLLVLVNAVLCDLITQKESRFVVLTELVAGSILLSAAYTYGAYRLADTGARIRNTPSKPVAIVQGNVDQSIKWDPRFQQETIRTYTELSGKAALGSPDLIVWPETATPFLFQQVDEKQGEVLAVARSAKAFLIFGSISYRRIENRTHFQNSAYLLSPQGEILGRYDKVHLVPYGEYVPLRPFFPFVEKLAVGVGDFLPGEGFEPLSMDGEKVGILICYEAIFPEISRAYRERGASFLVNLTNDAWFGKSSAPYQHLAITAFRAVENRLFIIRRPTRGSAPSSRRRERFSRGQRFLKRRFCRACFMSWRAEPFIPGSGIFSYIFAWLFSS